MQEMPEDQLWPRLISLPKWTRKTWRQDVQRWRRSSRCTTGSSARRTSRRRSASSTLKGKDGRYDYGSSGVLRRWLMDHDEPLHDEEHGLVAEMRPGGSTEIYDAAAAIKERDEPLYRRLEELGCFSIDASAVKAAVQKGWLTASDVAPFKHSLERSPSLTVRKVNE
jgi:hypothetical protein